MTTIKLVAVVVIYSVAVSVALLLLAGRGRGGNPGPTTCTPDICPPAATCVQGDGYISCMCPEGKTGTDCTLPDPCMPNMNCTEGAVCSGPCNPNVICEGATGYAHCAGCVAGYTWNGTSCLTDVDECTEWTDPPACLNGGVCTNKRGDFTCTCIGGWSGQECSVCHLEAGCDAAIPPITTRPETDDNGNNTATSGTGSRFLLVGVSILSALVL